MKLSRGPLLAVLIVGLSLVVAGVVLYHRKQTEVLSEVITRPAPEYGRVAHVLLPDLDGATVVIPNRPHDPEEARSADRFARIKRRRSFQVWTNHLGMRGPMPRDPKEGFRILCLGDSVTFGWGMPYEESYPARLAELLGVETIDAGVPAMKPSTIAAWAKDKAAGLQPDLVLFTRRPDWMVPDAWQDYERSVRAVEAAVRPARVAVILPPVSTFDAKGSAQWESEGREAARRVAPLPTLDLTAAFRAALPSPGVVMEQSGGHQVVKHLPDGEILLDVPAPAQGLAPEIVALFEGDEGVAEPFFFDGGHPDGPGFEIFARTVAEWLRGQGLVSGR